MNALFDRIRSRPLIAVTIAYVLVLMLLDHNGFFGRAPHAAVVPDETTVTGIVVSEPEHKGNRLSFIVKNDSSRGRILVTLYDYAILPLPGDHVRVTGFPRTPPFRKNPGGFDYARWLSRQGVYHLLYARDFVITRRRPQNAYSAFFRTLREDIGATFIRTLPPEEAGVLVPMLIGDKSLLTPEIKKEFNDAGLMHLLVVSGMNVAYVSLFFLFVFRVFGARPRIAALYTIPFLFAYMAVTGASPPVLRATVMAVFVILSLALAREPLIYHSLAMAALAILIVDPQALFTASFQLSFAATIGIVALYAPLKRPFQPFPPFLRSTVGNVFAVSFAAQLAVMPLMLFYFNKLSVAALISNLLAVPLAGFITVTGIALYALSGIPVLSGIAALAAHIPLSFMLGVVHYFSRLPWAVIFLPAPPIIVIVFYYTALFSSVQWRKHKIFPWISGVSAVLLAVTVFSGYAPGKDVAVTFLSLRQGNGAHIRFSDNTHWLIDGGSAFTGQNAGEQVILPYLRSHGIRRIDTIVVTHPDPAHFNGLAAVIDAMPVKRLLINPDYCEDKEYVGFLGRAGKKGIIIKEVWADDRFTVEGTTITIISPAVLSSTYDDNALVFSLDCGGKRILFTSDMSPERELELSRSSALLTCDVLQLPGDGIRMPDPEFLKKASPHSLIAAQGLPYPPSAKLFATETQGAITVTFKKCRRSRKTILTVKAL